MSAFYRSRGTCERVPKRSWLEPKPSTTAMLSRRCARLLPATKNWRSGSNKDSVRQECRRRLAAWQRARRQSGIRQAQGRDHHRAKRYMEALNWTRESIRRPGCRSITIRRGISKSIRACRTRPCRTAPRNFAHRMRAATTIDRHHSSKGRGSSTFRRGRRATKTIWYRADLVEFA
jgi:hypothetical protein